MNIQYDIDNLQLCTIPRPTKPTAVPPLGARPTQDKIADHEEVTKEFEFQTDVYNKGVKTYCKRLDVMKSNMKNTYNLVLGQCSEAIEYKVKANPQFATVEQNHDLIKLLNMI